MTNHKREKKYVNQFDVNILYICSAVIELNCCKLIMFIFGRAYSDTLLTLLHPGYKSIKAPKLSMLT